jgi:hypothetical protein
MDTYTFILTQPTHFFALLECDSCLPRLVLLAPNELVCKRAGNGVDAPMKIDLDKGTYTLCVGSVAGRGGNYELRVSDTEPTAKMPVFIDIAMRVQEGQKAKTYTALTARVGPRLLLIENTSGIVRSIKSGEGEGADASINHRWVFAIDGIMRTAPPRKTKTRCVYRNDTTTQRASRCRRCACRVASVKRQKCADSKIRRCTDANRRRLIARLLRLELNCSRTD